MEPALAEIRLPCASRSAEEYGNGQENSQKISRIALGGALIFYEISHLTFGRREFKAHGNHASSISC